MELLGNNPIPEGKEIGFPSTHPPYDAYTHGWFLETHIRVFNAVITPQTKIIIELGSWYGASTKWFAQHSNAIIFAIDLWDDDFILADNHYSNHNSELSSMLRKHPLYPTFIANLWDFRDRVVPMRMPTTEGLRFLSERGGKKASLNEICIVNNVFSAGIKPDIIYIDADHHYAAAKEDISTAQKLFPNALLVGDDYGNYEDVRRAVHEVANDCLKTVHVDNNHCWAYCSLSSRTGQNIAPKAAKGGVMSLIAKYKRVRGISSDTNKGSDSGMKPSTVSQSQRDVKVTSTSRKSQDHVESGDDEGVRSKKIKLSNDESTK